MKWPTWSLLGALVALGVLGFVTVAQCNRASRAVAAQQAAERRAKEQAAAVQAHVPTVVASPPADFKAFTAALLAENATLKQQLDTAQQAVPGAHVIAAISSSVEGAVHGTGINSGKLPEDPNGATPRPPDAPVPPPGAASPPVAVSSPATGGACLLADGDGLRLKLAGAVLLGPAGGHYLAGTQEAYRVRDGLLLLRAPLANEDVRVEEMATSPPRVAGWAYGGGLGGSQSGILASALLVTPPRRVPLVGWQGRLWILGAAGAQQGLALGGVLIEP